MVPFRTSKDAEQSSTMYHMLGCSQDGQMEEKYSNTRFLPLGKLSMLSRTLQVSIVLWNTLLIALTIYAIYALRMNSQHRGSIGVQSLDCSCGSSITEARAMNCKFDVLSLSWLPAHCRDDELTAEFEHSGPGLGGKWEYWADGTATIPMTVEEVALLAEQPDGYVFSSLSFHIAHCSYYWRKEFRMRARGLMMEGRYDKESHIEHCHAVFMSDMPHNKGMTRSLVRLGGDDFGESKAQHHHHAD